jgi:hypothetical protein
LVIKSLPALIGFISVLLLSADAQAVIYLDQRSERAAWPSYATLPSVSFIDARLDLAQQQPFLEPAMAMSAPAKATKQLFHETLFGPFWLLVSAGSVVVAVLGGSRCNRVLC